jgi:excisionase family DNA binding protein
VEILFAAVYSMGMVQMPAGDWLSVDEAAKLLGVSRRRVQALAKRGTLESTMWLGRYLIDRASARAFKAGPRKPGRPPKKSKKGGQSP